MDNFTRTVRHVEQFFEVRRAMFRELKEVDKQLIPQRFYKENTITKTLKHRLLERPKLFADVCERFWNLTPMKREGLV
jgi:hypothetical protein